MSKNLAQNLGIWKNEFCEKCGACCYDYNHDKLCRYQEIKHGKSYCKIHDSPQRDLLCQHWFCSELSEEDKKSFRHIALQLGTVPIFFSVFSILQQNLQEYKDFH